MPSYYERQQQLAEAFKDKLNALLENDSDIEVNSVDELEEKIKELTNPYHTLPEVKNINDIKQSTSADGWKYNKRNKRR